MRHNGRDELNDLWRGKSGAWNAVRTSKAWQHFERTLHIGGYVAATEVTYADPRKKGMGWHVHIHVLIFMGAELDGEEEVEGFRSAVFSPWKRKLERMGFRAPLLETADGHPIGADFKQMDPKDLEGYLTKQVYQTAGEQEARTRRNAERTAALSPEDRLAYEVSAGNVSKSGRRLSKTPMQMQLDFVESQTDDRQREKGTSFWYDLPKGGRVSFEGDSVFMLHDPGKTGEFIASEDPLRAEYYDPESGETWAPGKYRSRLFVPYSDAPYFEFAVASPRKKQIVFSQRHATPTNESQGLWNTAREGIDTEATDEEIVELDEGGQDVALISNESWKRALANDEFSQVMLQNAALRGGDALAKYAIKNGLDIEVLS